MINIDSETNSRHRGLNYRLCTAVDLLKLGMSLDELVSLGMPGPEAKLFRVQAGVLLAMLRTANNRLHGCKDVESAHF